MLTVFILISSYQVCFTDPSYKQYCTVTSTQGSIHKGNKTQVLDVSDCVFSNVSQEGWPGG